MTDVPAPGWIGPVPNALTVLRLALAVAFPFVPVGWRAVAIAAAGATDVLDGWIARRFHATTHLGRLLDGIADKAFVLTVVATLVVTGTVPWWAGLAVVARDLTVAGIAAWCAVRRAWEAFRHMSPRALGKATTGAVFLWFLAVVAHAPPVLRWIAFGLAAGASVAAAVDYAVQYVRRRPGASTACS